MFPPSFLLVLLLCLLFCTFSARKIKKKPKSCPSCDSYAQGERETVISLVSGQHKSRKDSTSLLAIILAFDTRGVSTLPLLIEPYVELCEAGFDVNIALLTTLDAKWEDTEFVKSFTTKYLCRRISAAIGLQTNAFNGSLGIDLAGKSREVLRANVDKYDVFVYQEEDMVVRASNVLHYLAASSNLKSTPLSHGGKRRRGDYMPGFLRYVSMSWGHTLIEEPKMQPVCLSSGEEREAEPYVVLSGNTHQGMFVLTHAQLLRLHKKCQFLNQDTFKTKREYFSSFSVFSEVENGIRHGLHLPVDPAAYCNVQKVIPAGALGSNFHVEHINAHRLAGSISPEDFYWQSLFRGSELRQIRALECWRGPLEEYQQHLAEIAKVEEAKKTQRGYSRMTFFPLIRASTAHTKALSVLCIIFVPMMDPAQALLTLPVLLSQHLSMCDEGFDVDVTLLSSLSASEWADTALLRSFSSEYNCSRTGKPIGLRVETFATAGKSLSSWSRGILKTHLDDFDLFVYQESDVVVSPAHIVNYVAESKALEASSKRGTCGIGFLQVYAPPTHSLPLPSPVVMGTPHIRPVCRGDRPYVDVAGNAPQGMYILTNRQLHELADTSGFLDSDPNIASRAFFASFALFRRPGSDVVQAHDLPSGLSSYTFLQKTIPADKLLEFSSSTLVQQPTWSQNRSRSLEGILRALARKRVAKTLGCWADMLRDINRSA